MTDDQDARAWEYARCTVQLQDDHETAGAEALYDQALTNGLLAIVASQWPGMDTFPNGKPKSARGLLEVIQKQVSERSPGVCGWIVGEEPWRHEVVVAAALLGEGIDLSQPIRHGRYAESRTRLQPIHIEALAALDQHPSLGKLSPEQFDEAWRQAHQRDRWAQEQAFAYVSMLEDSPGEWTRRTSSEYVSDFRPADPKELYSSPDPQDCPVCGQDAIISTSIDSYGIGFGAGTCCVCGYLRTEFIAEDLAFDKHVEDELAEPD